MVDGPPVMSWTAPRSTPAPDSGRSASTGSTGTAAEPGRPLRRDRRREHHVDRSRPGEHRGPHVLGQRRRRPNNESNPSARSSKRHERPPHRDQRGFTLVEVMLVCSMFLVVLGATMAAFTAFTTNRRGAEIQVEQAEKARRGLDVAARQLRNLANPTVNARTTIDRAAAYDFIFQTSDPAKTWVRYCLQTTGPASPNAARLWESESATAAISGAMRVRLPGDRLGERAHGLLEGLQPGRWRRPRRLRVRVRTRARGGRARRTPPSTPDHQCRDRGVRGSPRRRLAAGDARLDCSLPAEPERAADRGRNGCARLRRPSSSTGGPRPTPKAGRWSSSGSREPRRRQPTSRAAPPSPPTPSARGHLTHKFTEAIGATVNFWLVVRDPGCLTNTYPIPVVVPS